MTAPFHADLAEAPDGGKVIWRTASDGVRVRIGLWGGPDAKGTIFLLPGRTEYIEKYGRVISTLTARGYAVAVIDWRGHGYADRLADDLALGHVGRFADYQLDVAELVAAVREVGLPRPWSMLAHSLGGNIGLRALIEGVDIQRAVFSAPMWGIMIPKGKQLTAKALPAMARAAGRGLSYLPGARESIYATDAGYTENVLTSDPDNFAYFSRQANAVPEFALGGPSIHWFGEARAECRALFEAPRPDVPVLTLLGAHEAVVDPDDARAMHADWPSATLVMVDGGHHELMLDAPEVRDAVFDHIFTFLET